MAGEEAFADVEWLGAEEKEHKGCLDEEEAYNLAHAIPAKRRMHKP